MTQDILITGLTHYSPSPLEVIEQAKTQPIYLIKEDNNPVSPNAVAVFLHTRQIGYVADEYACILRAGITDFTQIQASFLDKDEDSDKVFWVSVDLDEWHEPTNAYHIERLPIHGLALPQPEPANTILRHETQAAISALWNVISNETEDLFPYFGEIADAAEQFNSIYGQSLNGEDRWMAIQLENLLNYLKEYSFTHLQDDFSDEVIQLYAALTGLWDIHHHYAGDGIKCLRIYNSEYNRAYQLMEQADFFSDYNAILQTQHISLKEEQQSLEQWLQRLPNNLYLHFKDMKRFATMLFYLHLPVEELYAVYAHIICLNHILKLQGSRKAQHQFKYTATEREQATLTLYTDHYDPKDMAFYQTQIRDVIRSDRYRKMPELVRLIKEGEANHLFRRNLGGNGKKFYTALCLEYGCKPSGYADFLKNYRRTR